jgi:2-oxoglutarate ferredoxin oxidoreductase subunit beta
VLKKIEREYDPTDKKAALELLREAREKNEFITGLIYVEPERQNFLELLDLVDEPLALLPMEKVRPPKEALDEVMERLR